jgi:Protein of unknown function (DUF3455)
VKPRTLHVATVLWLAALVQAQIPGVARADAPDVNAEASPSGNTVADIPADLQAPAGEKVILRAHAIGWQIYTCGAGADGKPQWTLKAPDADLHDQKGLVIGHHFAGPTWKYKDGSEVLGKAIAHVESPDSKSIPWLLVSATGHSGAGLFERVTSVQRVHTHGGKPPAVTECDPATPGTEVRSSYTADYYFYAPPR